MHQPPAHQKNSKLRGEKMDASFSERSFWRLLRKGDAQKYSLGKDRATIRTSLKQIEVRANSETFSFGKFTTQIRNKSKVFTTTSKEDEFILRKISDNLRRSLGIKPADRNELVPQAIKLAEEALDCSLYKFDISSFFENIDRGYLLESLRAETALDQRTVRLIENLLRSDQLKKLDGLPRGLSVSPILAEFYLKSFERKCRQLKYCYFYTRYVDDILFFCHADSNAIENDVRSFLPPGLSLNPIKTVTLRLDANGLVVKEASSASSISYLGYEIRFPHAKGELLRVSIPKKKISKIKSRIAMSVTRFLKDRDFRAFQLRIQFLTSNFKVGGSKQVGILYSGIYYNHRYMDTESAQTVLADLDSYLQKIVYSKTGSIGTKLGPLLNNRQRKVLCGNSFLRGYSQPVFRDFTNKELGEAKEVWAHA